MSELEILRGVCIELKELRDRAWRIERDARTALHQAELSGGNRMGNGEDRNPDNPVPPAEFSTDSDPSGEKNKAPEPSEWTKGQTFFADPSGEGE